MIKTYQLSLLALILSALSCTSTSSESTAAKESEAETTEETTADLTYRDLIRIVFDDEGEGIEWHGEASPNDLEDLLVITSGDPCGEDDCGNQLYLINNGDQSIATVVKGDFDIDGTQSYITRKYTIAASDTLMIGCSHLCADGKAYAFPRTIVASEYVVSQ